MSRYIDADAIVIRVERGICDDGLIFIPMRDVQKSIDITPTADVVEVKHGELKPYNEYYDDEYSECNVRKVYACSICGRLEKYKEPYCNCGAKMDGERKEQ